MQRPGGSKEFIQRMSDGAAIVLALLILAPALVEAGDRIPLPSSRGRYACLVESPNVLIRQSTGNRVPGRRVRKLLRANVRTLRLSLAASPMSRVRAKIIRLRRIIGEIDDCLNARGSYAGTIPPPAPTATPTPTPPPLLDQDQLQVVQGFNYYYPDLPVETHELRGEHIIAQSPRGQTTYATFLYRAAYDRSSVWVGATDLHSAEGETLLASAVEVGVVEVVDQMRSISTYLQNIYLRGSHLPRTADRRRVRQKIEGNPGTAPLPFLVVPNHADFINAVGAAGAYITLPYREGAETPVDAGTHRQFWIAINVPDTIRLSARRVTFEGSLRVVVDGAERLLPLTLTVFDYELDRLEAHEKSLCIYRAVTEAPAELKPAIIQDLKDHNVNSIVDSYITLDDYRTLRAHGFDSVVNLDWQYSASELAQLQSLGFRDLWMYTRDEPEYLVDDPNRQGDGWDIFTSRYNFFSSRGINVATAGMYSTSPSWYFLSYPHDWFAMSFRLSWSTSNPSFSYLRDVRQNPEAKIARKLGHYSATLSERYNLLTRLLYGPWLALSNLDFGCPYAYAPALSEERPFSNTSWDGVGFPVKYVNPDGAVHHYDMLSNQVWDAFGDGGKMFRMVLMAKRLVEERGSTEQQAQFHALMDPYKDLFPVDNRIDTLNFNQDLDALQEQLLNLIAELLPHA